MPMKGTGPADEWAEIDRWDGGTGWLAHPAEEMQRASHALAVDGDVWVVDPVDVPGLDDLLAEFGEVRGVLTLLDRHKRDGAKVATRHDVPVYLPGPLSTVADDISARTETFTGRVPDSEYETITVVDNRFWKEVALWDGETLLVPESVGTVAYYCTDDERLGVHPMRRLTPPRGTLGGLDPERILVGHGECVTLAAAEALDEALRGSRRNAISLYSKIGMEAIGF